MRQQHCHLVQVPVQRLLDKLSAEDRQFALDSVERLATHMATW